MNRITQSLVAATAGRRPRPRPHSTVPGLDINGQCVGDADSNQQILINELITAVNNALGGCPRLPITLKFSGVVGHEPFACGTEYDGHRHRIVAVHPGRFPLLRLQHQAEAPGRRRGAARARAGRHLAASRTSP